MINGNRDNLMSQPTAENARNAGSSASAVRLLIADDQPRVRQSLEALLTALRWSTSSRGAQPIEIVGEAGSGQQVVDQMQALQPDVVVLDLPTHDAAHRNLQAGAALDRLAVIRTIKREWPAVRVIVLTMYATDRVAVLQAGADAFLLKGCPTSELLAAVLPVQSAGKLP